MKSLNVVLGKTDFIGGIFMTGKIVVFGSLNFDITGRADVTPKPAETLMGTSYVLGPGGKGSNQAVAAHRAGADVTMITKIGNDLFGEFAQDFYKKEGLSSDYLIVDETKQTGIAIIMVSEQTGQNQILVISSACLGFTDEDLNNAKPALESCDILLMQHEVNLDANWKAVDIAKKAGVKVVLNPAPAQPVPDDVLSKIDIITPNEVEAGVLTGVEVKTPGDAAEAAKVFQSKGVKSVVITLGEQGAYVRSGDKEVVLARLDVDAVDTTGAGDAFNGGLVTALAEGKDIFESARFANVVGALSVTKKGASLAMPTREEIEEFIKSRGLSI